MNRENMHRVSSPTRRRASYPHLIRGLSTALALILLVAGAVPSAVTARPVAAPAFAPLSGSATWTDFQPQGWITSVPFTASVTVNDPAGLDPATAQYQTSTDGGANWSGWGTAGLSVGGTVSTTQTITVTELTLPDGPHPVPHPGHGRHHRHQPGLCFGRRHHAARQPHYLRQLQPCRRRLVQ